MIARLPLVVLTLALVACGADPAPPAAEEAGPPATFPAGEWEVSATVESVRAMDRFPPVSKAKAGDVTTRKVCAAPGPKPDPALFIDPGDDCTETVAYAKGGRINIGYQCTRPGQGIINPSIDGKYDATSFELLSVTGTQFAGQGDYVLTRKLRGKRLGDCTPGAAAPAAG